MLLVVVVLVGAAVRRKAPVEPASSAVSSSEAESSGSSEEESSSSQAASEAEPASSESAASEEAAASEEGAESTPDSETNSASSESSAAASSEAASSQAAHSQAAASSSHAASSSSQAASSAAGSTPSSSAASSGNAEEDTQVNAYIQQIKDLQKRSQRALYQTMRAAYDEYMQYPVEKRTLTLKVSIVLGKTAELTATQNQCDKEFKAIIKELRQYLRDNGYDQSIADAAEAEYKEKKDALTKELTDLTYSQVTGSGDGAHWLDDHYDEMMG